MKTFTFHSRQVLPVERDAVFRFFSDAANLEVLTPPWLGFNVLTPTPIAMAPGIDIDYRLKLRGIPLSWRSRIEVWDPPRRFVDVQVKGPYRSWVHEHRFEETAEGTVVEDRVEYAVWGGSLVNRFLVAPDIRKIFEYRRRKLDELFQASRSAAPAVARAGEVPTA